MKTTKKRLRKKHRLLKGIKYNEYVINQYVTANGDIIQALRYKDNFSELDRFIGKGNYGMYNPIGHLHINLPSSTNITGLFKDEWIVKIDNFFYRVKDDVFKLNCKPY